MIIFWNCKTIAIRFIQTCSIILIIITFFHNMFPSKKHYIFHIFKLKIHQIDFSSYRIIICNNFQQLNIIIIFSNCRIFSIRFVLTASIILMIIVNAFCFWFNNKQYVLCNNNAYKPIIIHNYNTNVLSFVVCWSLPNNIFIPFITNPSIVILSFP